MLNQEKIQEFYSTLKSEIDKKLICYQFHFPLLDVEKGIVVCQCAMKNPATGRVVEGVGQIGPDNTASNETGTHIVEAAAARAFYIAATRILSFDMSGGQNKDRLERGIHATPEVTDNINGCEVSAASASKRADLPDGVSDVILMGSLKGRKYSEIKDTKLMDQFLMFLKDNEDLQYAGEQQKQIDFFRSLI